MPTPAPSDNATKSLAPEPTDAEFDGEDHEEELREAPQVTAFSSGDALSGAAGVAMRRNCASCEAEQDDEILRSIDDDDELVQRKCQTCEDEDEIRRACASCEAEDEQLRRAYASCEAEDEQIRREPGAGRRGGDVSPDFSKHVRERVRGGGRPLSDYARNFLESRLGVDLGLVRVHDDAAADDLAQRIHARAFTLEQDIFFASGELQPLTHSGMWLLTHEVAHTLQTSRQLSPAAGNESLAIQRSSADDLVSSMDNTAEAVLDDLLAGAFYYSHAFEDRVRKLSKSERKLLLELLTSQSFVDQWYIDQ